MANEEHLKLLKQGDETWIEWRRAYPEVTPNFCDADLSGIKLGGMSLWGADLRRTDLRQTNLTQAFLVDTNLTEANLTGANLGRADLRHTDLRVANLSNAQLGGAHFDGAKLDGANLSWARLNGTIFANVDLSECKGLGSCAHWGPSIVDHRTLKFSENVPVKFWRGCGLPDALIDYMPSLTGDAIQFYSCFISYSSQDQEFADRLHADLQNAGVRCWFAPHDLPIGAKTWDGIDQAIRTRDKVLLILSEGAITSDWVEDEVTTAFAEERRRDELVLFPVRLDGAVLDTEEPWAGKLRDNRNIGDFSQWKDHDAYKATFDRVLRDLGTSR